MRASPEHDALREDARRLVCSLALDAGDLLLAERGYIESSPRARRCAWLMASSPDFVDSLLIEPMRTWGASASFEPLRHYERLSRISEALARRSILGVPYLMWEGKKTRQPPPARWRWAYWGLLAANCPLSLFVALPLAQCIAPATGSTVAQIFGSALLPLVFGELERRVLFAWWPWLNPARSIIQRWIAPKTAEAALATEMAAQCYALHASAMSHSLSVLISEPTFHVGLSVGKTAPLWAARGAARAALSTLMDGLREEGRDPGVDAALSVLAETDRDAIEAELGAASGGRRQARSI